MSLRPLAFALSLVSILVSVSAQAASFKCSDMQKSLYAKSTLKVRMVFGYKDARPARFVGDRHERLAFIERITAACDEGGPETCGFTRSPENADLFMKRISISGKEKKVLLWVVNSSVGTDDQENLSDPFQKWKSKYAEQAFLSGIKEADVVLYNGHSRFGGGPDFQSPQLDADGAVDPSPYKEARPGLTKMLQAFESSRRPKESPFKQLKILGLYSCSSSQHFNDEIRKVSPAGFVSSHVLMYYSDALNQSLSTLNAVLTKSCPKNLTFK